MSLRKIWNYRLIQWQMRKRSTVVFGYPYWLTIDPSSVCHLQCVFCPTGQRRGTRPPVILPFERFKSIIDLLGPYLLHIDFCNWGEPLLNKEVGRMVRYAKRFGPTVKIDTSLSIDLGEQAARDVVGSGLDRLIMSVDGASPATYGTYRRGGDFEKALSNMRLLVRTKKDLGGTAPHLHWQFLVFRHNEHEIETARRMARDIGVDSIGFTAPFCDPAWVSTKDEYNNYIVKEDRVAFRPRSPLCNWLWDGIAVNADGSVSPCCSVEEKKDDFGNLFDTPFWVLWNNEQYRTARRSVRDGKPGGKSNVCTRCDHIGASNHAELRRS